MGETKYFSFLGAISAPKMKSLAYSNESFKKIK